MTEKTFQATALQANSVTLDHEPIETTQLSPGQPAATTGYQQVGALGDAEIGVWEMSTGTMQDIEADEYFVVLTGAGTVQIQETEEFSAQELILSPGSLVRLHAGMKTVWTVTETLRKIYFTL